MNEPTTPIRENILKNLEKHDACPVSRVWYIARDCVIWLFLVATIVFGSIAVTVFGFVGMERWIQGGSVLGWLLMPMIWLALVVVLWLLSILLMRYTKYGYRHALILACGVPVVTSVVVGLVLHHIGVGVAVDRELGKYSAMYESHDKYASRLHNPAHGTWYGTILSVGEVSESGQIFTFKDVTDVVWTVVPPPHESTKQSVFVPGATVRVVGQAATSVPQYITACAILTHPGSKPRALKEWQAVRKRMYECMK